MVWLRSECGEAPDALNSDAIVKNLSALSRKPVKKAEALRNASAEVHPTYSIVHRYVCHRVNQSLQRVSTPRSKNLVAATTATTTAPAHCGVQGNIGKHRIGICA